MLGLVTALGLAVLGQGGHVAAQNTEPWSFPEVLTGAGAEPAGQPPAVAVDPTGAVHLVWVELDAEGQWSLQYRQRAPGGAWSVPQPIRRPDPGVSFHDPAVAVDALGQPHAVWIEVGPEAGRVRHSLRRTGYQYWTTPSDVTDGAYRAETPGVVWDLWGSVHVVWADFRLGSPDIVHRRRGHDGQWSPPSRVNRPIAGDQLAPSLTLSPGGTLHVVWQDSRHGQPDIYESRLPHAAVGPNLPGPFTWWPNARLNNQTAGRRQSDPVVVAEDTGVIHAVWNDDGRRIRGATLQPSEPFWSRDRTLHQSDAEVGRIAAAAGPLEGLALVWEAPGPRRTGLQAGTVGREGPLTSLPAVDAAPLAFDGSRPAVAIDRGGALHAAWLGTHRFGGLDLFANVRGVPIPPLEGSVDTGWLHYLPRRLSCPGDGYVLIKCNGEMGPMIKAPNVNPAFIGRYVQVSGAAKQAGACPLVHATEVVLASSPCPRSTGNVTGVLTRGGEPMMGMRVHLGDQLTVTGASGRFFFPEVEPGTHVITGTTDCALTGRTTARVSSGFTQVVDPGELVLGDVVADCRVDLKDLVRVTADYQESPPFAPACNDLDRDGSVTIYDVAAVSGAYGAACPGPWGGLPDPVLPEGDPSRTRRLALQQRDAVAMGRPTDRQVVEVVHPHTVDSQTVDTVTTPTQTGGTAEADTQAVDTQIHGSEGVDAPASDIQIVAVVWHAPADGRGTAVEVEIPVRGAAAAEVAVEALVDDDAVVLRAGPEKSGSDADVVVRVAVAWPGGGVSPAGATTLARIIAPAGARLGTPTTLAGDRRGRPLTTHSAVRWVPGDRDTAQRRYLPVLVVD